MKRLTGLIILALAGCGALAAGSLGQGSTTAGLAFIKDGGATTTVWVAAANGTGVRKLGVGEGALLSPNGQLVASASPNGQLVASSGSGPGRKLLVYEVGGGVLAGVPPLTKDTVMPLAWSPDSTYLAVELYDTELGTGAGNGAFDVIDIATGKITATAAGVVEGASFAPTGGDRVVFGLTQSQTYTKPANLYTMPADGSAAATPITHDGHSIDPVWGARGIVFVRTRTRGKNEAPAYHLELLNGTTVTPIASPKPSALVDGLYPVAISSGGQHLLAEFAGEDTSQAYAVNLATNRFKQLGATQDSAQGWGISRDGTRVLISHGGFENPSKYSTIATVPFGGGKPTPLVKGGDFPTWNQ